MRAWSSFSGGKKQPTYANKQPHVFLPQRKKKFIAHTPYIQSNTYVCLKYFIQYHQVAKHSARALSARNIHIHVVHTQSCYPLTAFSLSLSLSFFSITRYIITWFNNLILYYNISYHPHRTQMKSFLLLHVFAPTSRVPFDSFNSNNLILLSCKTYTLHIALRLALLIIHVAH